MRRGLGLRGYLALALGSSSFFWGALAAAEPVRILLAVGNRVGLPAEAPLKYAGSDAERVREVLVGYGGVRAEHATVLLEGSRSSVYNAIDAARLEAMKHRPEDVTLVFYFSGHGDRDAVHLGDDRVLLSDLTGKLAEVPAGLRIAITDACRTNREKGFSLDDPFAISTATATEASGQVWLHASRDGEAAQESDELQGAIFTHSWLSGLRGAADVNGDARVTLDESFSFAHSQTLLRSAKSSGVLQKPEAVVSLREHGPVILTETATTMASLSLPPVRDAFFLVYAPSSKSILAELWGTPDRRTSLSLPAGRYVIQRRAGSLGGLATLSIAAGEERRIENADFLDGPLGPVASKGEDATPPTPIRNTRRGSEVTVGYAAGSDTRTGFSHGPRASYALAWAGNEVRGPLDTTRFALSIHFGANFADRTVNATTEHLSSYRAGLATEFRLPLFAGMLVRTGAGLHAGWLTQALESTTLDGTRSSRQGGFLFGPDLFVSLRAPLGQWLFADVGVLGEISMFREDEKVTSVPGAMLMGSVGTRF